MENKHYVHVGYRLDDQAIPVPAAGQMQIRYSVDPWRHPPAGYVEFHHDGEVFDIPESDIARFSD
jgi:hypothetical protein